MGVPPVRHAPARLGPTSPVTAARPPASEQNLAHGWFFVATRGTGTHPQSPRRPGSSSPTPRRPADSAAMAARFPGLRVRMQNALICMVAGQPEVDSAAAPIGGSGASVPLGASSCSVTRWLCPGSRSKASCGRIHPGGRANASSHCRGGAAINARQLPERSWRGGGSRRPLPSSATGRRHGVIVETKTSELPNWDAQTFSGAGFVIGEPASTECW